MVRPHLLLDVFREVNYHRPWAAVGGQYKGFFQCGDNFTDVAYLVVSFGCGPRQADGVAFLERIGSDQQGRHLAADADQRDGIAQRIDKS